LDNADGADGVEKSISKYASLESLVIRHQVPFPPASNPGLPREMPEDLDLMPDEQKLIDSHAWNWPSPIENSSVSAPSIPRRGSVIIPTGMPFVSDFVE